jgi:hypothetical protein
VDSYNPAPVLIKSFENRAAKPRREFASGTNVLPSPSRSVSENSFCKSYVVVSLPLIHYILWSTAANYEYSDTLLEEQVFETELKEASMQ